MKRFIKSDYFLMLLSVLIAVLIWIFVVYEQNPMHETWLRGVPVTYTNQTTDFENGKLVIMDGIVSDIDIKIRGRRSVISTVDASSVTCSVNMGEITEPGSYTLPVTFNTAIYGVELVQKKPNSVSFVVDSVVTDEREIRLVETGDVADGYVAGEAVCTPQVVKITGPSKLLGNIHEASVAIDYTDATQDIANLYKIKLFDRNGNEITDERISKNIEYCDIKCPVYMAKKVAVVPVMKTETNSSGQKVSVTKVTPAEVMITGNEEDIKKIESLYTEEIDVSGVTDVKTIKAKLDFSEWPQGIITDGDVLEAEVELTAEEEDKKDDGGNE